MEALSLVTMNPDGSVRVWPYNSWIFKVPMKWKIKLLKNKLIKRAFQSKEGSGIDGEKKVIPVFACDLLGKTSQKFISSN